jgi:hypothetical protein
MSEVVPYLPKDVVFMILKFVDNEVDLKSCSLVCIRWLGVIRERQLMASPWLRGKFQHNALAWENAVEIRQGTAWVCGLNINASLGIGHSKKIPEFVPVDLKNVVGVSLGYRFTVFVTESGVYTAGENYDGQGGHTKQRFVGLTLIQELTGGVSVVAVGIGHSHAVMATTEGCFSWGRNYCGQLGLGGQCNEPQKVFSPTRITDLDGLRATHVACGSSNSFVVCKEGLFGFGDQGGSSLIDPSHRGDVCLPTSNPFFVNKRISAIAVWYHVMTLVEGRVIVFGSNGYGQLGLGDTSYRKEPQVLTFFDDKAVQRLFVTDTACAVKCAEGSFAWGNNYGLNPVSLFGEQVDALGNPLLKGAFLRLRKEDRTNGRMNWDEKY